MPGYSRFLDSIKNLYNDLVNSRAQGPGQNTVTSDFVSHAELRQIYRTGLASKIVRLKAGHALSDTLQFEREADETIYHNKIERHVKRATRFMIAFGRGIIVLYEPGEDLSTPRTKPYDYRTVGLNTFSGDMVTGVSPHLDLMHPRYYKPTWYSVRGRHFHYTRVIDFTYVEPPELDSPQYQYGGISEFELIYTQLINDGIVERASPTILEKNSTLFYQVKGFKEAMQDGREKDMREYFRQVENGRSIYGAGLLDMEDNAFTVEQNLTNLSDADMITLRRLAMVTGISITLLVGENAKGLNSSGENERKMDQDMIESLQEEYIKPPLCDLFAALNLGKVWFKDNQGRTADQRIQYETSAITNARQLYEMGEDHSAYLEEHDIIKRDDYDELFASEPDAQGEEAQRRADAETIAEFEQAGEQPAESEAEGPADRSLNGAQIESLLNIIQQIRTGQLTRETATGVISAAFPLSEAEARALVRDVPEGVDEPDGQEDA